MEDCPPLEFILENLETLPKKLLGGGGFSNVYLFTINDLQYAVKIIPIETEEQIEIFKTEVLNWKMANSNPRLREIVPQFCESALISKEALAKFKTPIYSYLNLYTEHRNPENAIAFGFIFTKAVNYIEYHDIPKKYENITQLIDNLIEALDILHGENFIHGDIKLHNILIRDEPGFPVFFIDLEGLCKLPCERSIPYTPDYVPPDFSNLTKQKFRFLKRNNEGRRVKMRTKVTNKTFTRFSKEMDRYAMGKVILVLLNALIENDARWGSDSSPEEKEMKEAYFKKAYTLLRNPIHIYAAEIGQSKSTRKNRRISKKTRRRGKF